MELGAYHSHRNRRPDCTGAGYGIRRSPQCQRVDRDAGPEAYRLVDGNIGFRLAGAWISWNRRDRTLAAADDQLRALHTMPSWIRRFFRRNAVQDCIDLGVHVAHRQTRVCQFKSVLSACRISELCPVGPLRSVS